MRGELKCHFLLFSQIVSSSYPGYSTIANEATHQPASFAEAHLVILTTLGRGLGLNSHFAIRFVYLT